MAGKLHGTPDLPEESTVLARASARGTSAGPAGFARRVRHATWLLLTTLLTTWLVLLAFDSVLPDMGLSATLLTAMVLVVLNAFVLPFVSGLAVLASVWTFGVLGLLLNAAIVTAAINVLPGTGHVDLTQTLLLVVVLVALSSLLAGVFGVELESEWYLRSVRRRLRRRGEVERSDVPGVLLLEIDGLAAPVMRHALRDGYLPTLARWLRSGSHRAIEWECDLSSQTSASQAGLLLGSNDGIPAFRWYDRAAGRVVVSSSPRDVSRLERRLSTGHGLLADGGASRVNLFTGDADRIMFTLSSIGVAGRHGARDYAAYFSQPFHMVRTLVSVVQDIALELWHSADQRRRNVWPRVHRHGTYPLLRAFTTVVQRDLAVAALEQDMLRGTPRAYATFVGYDEVAHHSGVERTDALGVLRRLDARFAQLERVRELAPRPYEFVVLSDHGQCQGATFQQRFGLTLEQFVREAAAVPVQGTAQGSADDEARGQIASVLGEVGTGTGVGARLARAAGEHHEREAQVEQGGPGAAGGEQPRLLVLPSGNLANVYVAGAGRRLARDELESQVPGLVDALAAHPGVGFAMVRTGPGADDAVVLGRGGQVDLASGRVTGVDPLRGYGENALRHLRRTNGFADVGDVLVMGAYDPALDEVTAFEQLCGSHGGLGGGQARPFAVFPAGWYEPSERIVGAEAMHRVLKRWFADAGQDVVLPDGMDALPPDARG